MQGAVPLSYQLDDPNLNKIRDGYIECLLRPGIDATNPFNLPLFFNIKPDSFDLIGRREAACCSAVFMANSLDSPRNTDAIKRHSSIALCFSFIIYHLSLCHYIITLLYIIRSGFI